MQFPERCLLSARRAWRALALTLFITGTVDAADDLTKPIRVSPNGHFLTEPGGEPFFWLADTAWPLFARLTREEADVYLKDRAAKGFNVIQAVAIGGPFDDLEVPNRYGELALIEKDPLRPNPKYFEHIDWVVNRAAHYGLRIAMLPVWGTNQVGGVGQRPIFEPQTAQAYGRWVGARYRNNGIIWVLGGDTNPLWPKEMDIWTLASGKANPDMTLIDHRPIYDAMARGLIDGDGGDPFITFHPCGVSFSGMAPPRTSRYFHDREWLDMNMLQSSHFAHALSEIRPQVKTDFNWIGPYNYEPIREEYDSLPTRPIVDGEPRYENMAVDVMRNAAHGSWTTYDARNAAYHSVFAGAAGHTFGNTSVHLLYDPVRPRHAPDDPSAPKPHLEVYPGIGGPWQEQLHAPGAQQMRHLKNLMLSRPYFSRIPDQSILKDDAGEGSQHIGATRDKAGSYAMVVVPDGRPIRLDLSKLAGLRAVAWWFDPRTGKAMRVPGNYPTTGTVTFTPPSSGAQSDWVLVVDDESESFGPPGKMPH